MSTTTIPREDCVLLEPLLGSMRSAVTRKERQSSFRKLFKTIKALELIPANEDMLSFSMGVNAAGILVIVIETSGTNTVTVQP